MTGKFDLKTVDYWELQERLPEDDGTLTPAQRKAWEEVMAIVRRCEDAVLNGERESPGTLRLRSEHNEMMENYNEQIDYGKNEVSYLERRLEEAIKKQEKRVALRAERMKESIEGIERSNEEEKKRILSTRS